MGGNIFLLTSTVTASVTRLVSQVDAQTCIVFGPFSASVFLMEGVSDRGLIHVDDVTWMFPLGLFPYHINKMPGLLFHVLKVLLCNMHCYVMSQPHALHIAHDRLHSCLKGFTPEQWEQATCFLSYHAGTNLYPFCPCL